MATEQEFPCEWTCPKCRTFQRDSVNPELGPFVTCTCTECGVSFSDSDLDPVSLASWEAARLLAEDAAGIAEEMADKAERRAGLHTPAGG